MKIIIGLLVLSLFLVGCATECPPQEMCDYSDIVCLECEDDKAMLSAIFDGWGENIDNEEEILFQLSILNYGDVEAKDVEVTCKAYRNDETILEEVKNIGNIASNSYDFKQISIKWKPRETDVGMCYITGCSDCILLDDKIPELVELRGGSI